MCPGLVTCCGSINCSPPRNWPAAMYSCTSVTTIGSAVPRRARRNAKAEHKARLARIAAELPAYTDDEFNSFWPNGTRAKGDFGF
jgi:hypothetical protein